MDPGRTTVRQLVGTEFVIGAQYYGAFPISDNCKNWLCNHASCAPSRAVVETIEPKHKTQTNKHIYLFNVYWMMYGNIHVECKFLM